MPDTTVSFLETSEKGGIFVTLTESDIGIIANIPLSDPLESRRLLVELRAELDDLERELEVLPDDGGGDG